MRSLVVFHTVLTAMAAPENSLRLTFLVGLSLLVLLYYARED